MQNYANLPVYDDRVGRGLVPVSAALLVTATTITKERDWNVINFQLVHNSGSIHFVLPYLIPETQPPASTYYSCCKELDKCKEFFPIFRIFICLCINSMAFLDQAMYYVRINKWTGHYYWYCVREINKTIPRSIWKSVLGEEKLRSQEMGNEKESERVNVWHVQDFHRVKMYEFNCVRGGWRAAPKPPSHSLPVLWTTSFLEG